MFAQPTVHQTGINNYQVTHGDDRQLHAEFYDREILDEAATREAGRPIHKNVPYILLIASGNNLTRWDRPVDFNGVVGGHAPDTLRWPAAYAAYKNQTVMVPDGTSLLEWAPLPRSEAKDLKKIGIHTVEQLAEMSDSNLNFLGAMALRNKAKAWLLSATTPAAAMKLQAENDSLRADVEMLKQQIQDLAAQLTPTDKTKTLTLKPKGE